jgi:hypothetical protein
LTRDLAVGFNRSEGYFPARRTVLLNLLVGCFFARLPIRNLLVGQRFLLTTK